MKIKTWQYYMDNLVVDPNAMQYRPHTERVEKFRTDFKRFFNGGKYFRVVAYDAEGNEVDGWDSTQFFNAGIYDADAAYKKLNVGKYFSFNIFPEVSYIYDTLGAYRFDSLLLRESLAFLIRNEVDPFVFTFTTAELEKEISSRYSKIPLCVASEEENDAPQSHFDSITDVWTYRFSVNEKNIRYIWGVIASDEKLFHVYWSILFFNGKSGDAWGYRDFVKHDAQDDHKKAIVSDYACDFDLTIYDDYMVYRNEDEE